MKARSKAVSGKGLNCLGEPSCWDEGANRNFRENLSFFFFFLSILTGIHVLCWPNQCNSLAWRVKDVYFECEHSFLFWLSASHGALHMCFFRNSNFPLKSSTASPFLEVEIALMSAIKLYWPPCVVSIPCTSFCLSFPWMFGCRHHSRLLFPFQDCLRTIILHTVELCRGAGSHTGRDQAALVLYLLISQL